MIGWGKVIGGILGYMMGGLLGALVGVALGHYFDSGFRGISLDPNLGRAGTQRVQSTFFNTTFTIMGYLAKSDGQVTRDEIAMAEHVMAQMRLNAQQRKVAIDLFNEGKKPDFPVHEALQKFKRECQFRRNLLQMFLEIVIATALSDGRLHSREQKILEEIAADLGFSQAQFQQLLSRLSGMQHFQSPDSIADRLEAAYELLGITAQASDAEVKKAYRRQMSQHHPDKLVSKGLPKEMMEMAKQKTQDIKAAYELITEQRA